MVGTYLLVRSAAIVKPDYMLETLEYPSVLRYNLTIVKWFYAK